MQRWVLRHVAEVFHVCDLLFDVSSDLIAENSHRLSAQPPHIKILLQNLHIKPNT